jgi:thymidylate synthase ThyX
MNARDLYHFFGLRCDKHAGHEIRTLATKMLEICKEKEPMLFMLACGKDDFERTKEELFKE